jgi:hypothetical protein
MFRADRYRLPAARAPIQLLGDRVDELDRIAVEVGADDFLSARWKSK